MVSRNARYRASNFPLSSIYPLTWRSRFSAARSLFPRWLSLTFSDQAPQALADIETPGARAAAVTLDHRHQTHVGEAQLGLIALPGDVKNDVRAVPLPPATSHERC